MNTPTVMMSDANNRATTGAATEQENMPKTHSNNTTGKVHRPWGWYDSLDAGEGGAGHQVKRIHVHAGGSLSLQSHAHRAEHWVVVQGCATIGLGAAANAMVEKDYSPGQYVYIPLGNVHRLSNKTNRPVDIIEVQCGGYLGEDDIVRYEDVYGRV